MTDNVVVIIIILSLVLFTLGLAQWSKKKEAKKKEKVAPKAYFQESLLNKNETIEKESIKDIHTFLEKTEKDPEILEYISKGK